MTYATREPLAPVTSDVVTEHPSSLARVGQVLIIVAGSVLVLSGALTLAKTGIQSDLSTPVVRVMGHSHTAWLGIAELVAGLLLLGAGASAWNRELAVVLGVLLLVAGFVFVSDHTVAPRALAIDDGYGRFLIVTGGLALVGGLLPGGWVTHRARGVHAR